MRVRVLFFGMLKDLAGCAGEELEVPAGTRLEEIFECYAARAPKLRELRASIVMARNHEFARGPEEAQDRDEIAFLPPVSGGSGPYTHEIVDQPAGHFFALTREPIDLGAIAAGLRRPEDGAVVYFDGVVRNNTKGRPTLHLDYECYEPMALKMMAEIGRQIAAGGNIGRIGMVHRLGRLRIGETSVAIVVTAPHRQPAFAACLEGINRLKRLVPIWKKEYFAGGDVWAEGEWDASVLKK